MIESFSLTNFKSWRGTHTIELAPITLLLGTNSAGKSSLAKALLCLKQTAESIDQRQTINFGDQRSLVDLGAYRDVIFGHDETLDLGLGVSWARAEPLELRKTGRSALSASRFSFDTQLQQDGATGSVTVEKFSYELDGRVSVGMERRDDDKYDLSTSGIKISRKPGRPWPLPPPLKCYAFPDAVQTKYQNADFLVDISFEFDQTMSAISYVGPLRDFPQRNYVWGGTHPADVGSRGESTVEAVLAARAQDRTIPSGEGKGRRYIEFAKVIESWLRKMGVTATFRVKEIARGRKIYEVVVKSQDGGPEVLVAETGFGVSQILPVIVQSFYAAPGSLSIFEQPEIHLHPRVQSELGDLFIDAQNRNSAQFIIETHSEHLVRRLQRRVAEQEISSGDVKIYVVNAKRGISTITDLPIDEFGRIRRWPEHFFGDEMGEILAASRAAARRRSDAM